MTCAPCSDFCDSEIDYFRSDLRSGREKCGRLFCDMTIFLATGALTGVTEGLYDNRSLNENAVLQTLLGTVLGLGSGCSFEVVIFLVNCIREKFFGRCCPNNTAAPLQRDMGEYTNCARFEACCSRMTWRCTRGALSAVFRKAILGGLIGLATGVLHDTPLSLDPVEMLIGAGIGCGIGVIEQAFLQSRCFRGSLLTGGNEFNELSDTSSVSVRLHGFTEM